MFFKGTVYGVNGGKHSYLIVASTEVKARGFMETSSNSIGALTHTVELINSSDYMTSDHAKQFDGIQYVE